MPETISDSSILKFPQGFLWGASNSAFQSEGGGNVTSPNSDWEVWARQQQSPDFWPDKSSSHYDHFKQDFALLKRLGHNSQRFSLEWARIEPASGEFDKDAIQHYKEVLKTLKDLNMKSAVTLLHFTHPVWFAEMGGWENPKSSEIFTKFVEKVSAELGQDIDLWITLNEPTAYAFFAYAQADFPPQKRNLVSALRVLLNLAKAHNSAYAAIKTKYPDSSVGFTNAVVSTDAFHQNSVLYPSEKLLARVAFQLNHLFYFLTDKNSHDFIGLQYYESRAVKFQKKFPWLGQGDLSQEKTSLGWNIYPKGLYDSLKSFNRYQKPIYITENGIATSDDYLRQRFLVHHLKAVFDAISEGVDARGYFYWSAFDNMELHRGYDPRFGLIGVDFKTQKRTPKPSAYIYKQIIDNNGIPADLLKLPGFN